MEVVQMNNAEVIKGIETVIEGLNIIKQNLSAADGGEQTAAPKSTVKREKAQKEAPAEEKETKTVEGHLTREQLDSMKYNELKKLGASLGVKCTGTRDEITEKILAVTVTAEVEADEESSDDSKKNSKVVPMRKAAKKSAKAADEDEEDEFTEQAKEIAETTEADDIIEALADVNIKATTKNYVTKLADALRKGLIEFEEDDEETVTEGEDSTTDEDAEITPDTYFAEYDPDGYNDPDEMTEERAEAVQEMVADILKKVEEEELTEDDMCSFIEDNTNEDEQELLPDEYAPEQLVGFYIELKKRFIDDDGVEHEPSDPYEIGDKEMCCGHELKYSKKTKKYICETCGEEYEAE